RLVINEKASLWVDRVAFWRIASSQSFLRVTDTRVMAKLRLRLWPVEWRITRIRHHRSGELVDYDAGVRDHLTPIGRYSATTVYIPSLVVRIVIVKTEGRSCGKVVGVWIIELGSFWSIRICDLDIGPTRLNREIDRYENIFGEWE